MVKKLTLLICLILNVEAFGQVTVLRLRQFISDNPRKDTTLKKFYNSLNYQTAWIKSENKINLDNFVTNLKRSADLGLRESDYNLSYIEGFRGGSISLQSLNDSLEAEVCIAEAAIHFYHDIAYGNSQPHLGYNGLNYQPGCLDIPDLVADHIAQGILHLLPTKLSPPLPEIAAIETKMRWFHMVMAESNFKEIIISSVKADTSNKPLIVKLYQLGIIDSADKKLSGKTLIQKVQEAQRQFNLMADGVLRSTIMTELNMPLYVRSQQLKLAVNYYRWFYCLLQDQPVIVVNIPAAYMKVYRDGKVILEMKMVLGRKSTPTPTLASRVSEVILYPYWHVPHSIATKELLPAIKKNPAVLDAGNYQVLDGSGKIMDPYAVNWNLLSSKNFPYILRQSTGCDNALGLLKLNFYSPFGVYLHDTPFKAAFSLNKRYFSHGCLRMEKPMELGHLVLKNNPLAIDTLEEKGCLRNQSPIYVTADERMPVIVWYNPAGVDATGRVLFYEDVYRKFDWMKKIEK